MTQRDTTALQRYEQAQALLKKYTREHDKAQASFDHLMKELEEQFDCSTIAEAREMLDRLENEANTSERKMTKMLDKFDSKWGEKIKEKDDGDR